MGAPCVTPAAYSSARARATTVTSGCARSHVATVSARRSSRISTGHRPVEIDDERDIAASLPVRPVVDADHAWGGSRRGLVAADAAQHDLAAPRQALPCELADACRPAQHQASVTLGLAHPGGGVSIRASHGRHALGEGALATGGRITEKAPDVEVESQQGRSARVRR